MDDLLDKSLSRRKFIKFLGLTALATQLPGLQIFPESSYASFNPNNMYGSFIWVDDHLDKKLILESQRGFDEEISRKIPPKHRNKIEWIIKQIGSLRQRSTIGWKYSPDKPKFYIKNNMLLPGTKFTSKGGYIYYE